MGILSYNNKHELGNHDPKSALAYAPTHTTLGYSEGLFTMTCYVYLVTDGEFTKIGLSHTPYQRLRGIERERGFKLKLAYLIPCPDINAATILELDLHSFFRRYREWGEWFSLHPENITPHIDECVSTCLPDLGVLPHRKSNFHELLEIKAYLPVIERLNEESPSLFLANTLARMRLRICVLSDTKESIRFEKREVHEGIKFVSLVKKAEASHD